MTIASFASAALAVQVFAGAQTGANPATGLAPPQGPVFGTVGQGVGGVGSSILHEDVAPMPIPSLPGTAIIVQPDSTVGFAPSYTVYIKRTGTYFKGELYTEAYRIQLPPKVGDEPSPVLVAFHGFGQSIDAVADLTTYEEECAERNWFLVIPLQASKKGYGALPGQANAELVLDQVLGLFGPWIDPRRLYAVGFSMGGGDALNFAARHLDPNRWSFAAVANHTGGIDRKFTYWNSPQTQWIFEFWHDGNPTQWPFRYEQTGLIEFDATTLATQDSNDFARNLAFFGVHHWEADQDPGVVQNGVSQTSVLQNHLNLLGIPSGMTTVHAAVHEWGTVPEHQVCEWLGRHELQLPSSGSVLADRDGPWWYFDLSQDAAGAFTPFEFAIDEASNALTLKSTENLAHVFVETQQTGLDPTQTLRVTLAASDGLADTVTLGDFHAPPSQVLRDGQPTAAWTYSPGTSACTLLEFDSSQHTWELRP